MLFVKLHFSDLIKVLAQRLLSHHNMATPQEIAELLKLPRHVYTDSTTQRRIAPTALLTSAPLYIPAQLASLALADQLNREDNSTTTATRTPERPSVEPLEELKNAFPMPPTPTYSPLVSMNGQRVSRLPSTQDLLHDARAMRRRVRGVTPSGSETTSEDEEAVNIAPTHPATRQSDLPSFSAPAHHDTNVPSLGMMSSNRGERHPRIKVEDDAFDSEDLPHASDHSPIHPPRGIFLQPKPDPHVNERRSITPLLLDPRCRCGRSTITAPSNIDWAGHGIDPPPTFDTPFPCSNCKKAWTHHANACSQMNGFPWITQDMERDFLCFNCWSGLTFVQKKVYEDIFFKRHAAKLNLEKVQPPIQKYLNMKHDHQGLWM